MTLHRSVARIGKTEEGVVPIVSFVGRSNSGKTMLLEQVVGELKSRGYRVGVVKHTPHSFDIDHPGKDTWRLAHAGADVVAISSPDKVAFVQHVAQELSLVQVRVLFAGKVDVLLTEGYKNEDTAKILVLGSNSEEGPPSYKGELLVTVSPYLSPLGVPQFEYSDVVTIADLLVEKLTETSSPVPDGTSNTDTATGGYHTHPADEFEELLAESAAAHGHLCSGQILGVRMAMCGCRELGLGQTKHESKRLIVYVEIDRCLTDAIRVVTGCSLGRRTMKHMDYGKPAATFVDLQTGNAVRVVAREDARDKVWRYCSKALERYEAQAVAYRIMPDEALFDIQRVTVRILPTDMPGRPQSRVICDACGEGVNDGREVRVGRNTLCRACAYGGYYKHGEQKRSLLSLSPWAT